VSQQPADDPLLEVAGLDAAVEGLQVTDGVSLEVNRGEAVGLVGRNGAGKTTTFRTIMGLATVLGGSVRFDGEELTSLRAEVQELMQGSGTGQ